MSWCKIQLPRPDEPFFDEFAGIEVPTQDRLPKPKQSRARNEVIDICSALLVGLFEDSNVYMDCYVLGYLLCFKLILNDTIGIDSV